jgi:hypothetical protein
MKSIKSELSSLRLMVASRACSLMPPFFKALFSVIRGAIIGLTPGGDLTNVRGLVGVEVFGDFVLLMVELDLVLIAVGNLGSDFASSGPVERMKSAKSLILSFSTLASLA